VNPPTTLCSVPQALDILTADSPVSTKIERVPTGESLGRVIAQDIVSTIDVPPRDNSAMDGYAFSIKDCPADGTVMAISQTIPAGYAPKPLAEGTAARILTGAEIPAGADTVQIQESCVADGESLDILKAPRAGANIRAQGQDIKVGATLVNSGRRLRPQEVGVMASAGLSELDVYRPLKVALVSSGDELVEPGDPLLPGQIYNSNRYTLQALVQSLGMEFVYCGVAPDNLSDTTATLARAAQAGDVVISAGGVSVGDEDHVKPAVESLGEITLWKIAIKPGKPLAYGNVCGTPFMGLPGNPVSVFVTFLVLARPWLLKMQGRNDFLPVPTPVTALFSRPPGDRAEYLRARLTPEGVEIFQQLGSGIMTSTSWSDGLVVHPVGEAIEPGQVVQFLPYEHLFR
jgi:molybdopterin molybdotransferase